MVYISKNWILPFSDRYEGPWVSSRVDNNQQPNINIRRSSHETQYTCLKRSTTPTTRQATKQTNIPKLKEWLKGICGIFIYPMLKPTFTINDRKTGQTSFQKRRRAVNFWVTNIFYISIFNIFFNISKY